MGSAALAHCAARGACVLGIEQFGELHDLGASSGKTRIIRQAYYEDPAYVPLLLRAYELWQQLERETGEDLLRLAGLLMVGRETSDVIAGSSRAAKAYDLPVEYLNAGDIRRRYPMLRINDDEVAVYERNGGALFPERAVRAHLRLARERGAEMLFGAAMQSWHADADGVAVALSDGTRVRANALVLALGPWFGDVLGDAGVPLEVQRNVQVWFTPASAAYAEDAFPAFLLERDALPAPLYGFPDFGDGVKAAFHGWGASTAPAELARDIDVENDVEPLAHALEQFMPGAAARFRDGKACMYSLTPDRHFVVDRHPADTRVILCGGFSGHGFKFASVIGELAAQLAFDGTTRCDIGFLSIRRFNA
jgi:sarcosine oxidase